METFIKLRKKETKSFKEKETLIYKGKKKFHVQHVFRYVDGRAPGHEYSGNHTHTQKIILCKFPLNTQTCCMRKQIPDSIYRPVMTGPLIIL